MIASISYTLPNGVENLTLTSAGNLNGTGKRCDNIIIGNGGNNVLTGGGGNDTLTGGTRRRHLRVRQRRHRLDAGHRDGITDFTPGTDKIDLTGLDGDSSTSGTQAFRFLGSAAFDGTAGALHTSYDSVRNVTVLEGDTNGDKVGDFGIDLPAI